MDELNKNGLWGAEAGNDYLEALTNGGLDFQTLEGQTLLIAKALYELQSPGLCWHQRFADILRDLCFSPLTKQKNTFGCAKQMDCMNIL
jgi:hypothetical protein